MTSESRWITALRNEIDALVASVRGGPVHEVLPDYLPLAQKAFESAAVFDSTMWYVVPNNFLIAVPSDAEALILSNRVAEMTQDIAAGIQDYIDSQKTSTAREKVDPRNITVRFVAHPAGLAKAAAGLGPHPRGDDWLNLLAELEPGQPEQPHTASPGPEASEEQDRVAPPEENKAPSPSPTGPPVHKIELHVRGAHLGSIPFGSQMRPFIIGRLNGNLQIPETETTVSRRHLEIRYDPTGFAHVENLATKPNRTTLIDQDGAEDPAPPAEPGGARWPILVCGGEKIRLGRSPDVELRFLPAPSAE